jgi:uncharacterized damage-inducible protein DinB
MSSNVEQIRKLIGFNEWANSRVLSASEKLTPEQYNGLAEQFAHMLGAQRFWHARWTGAEYGSHVTMNSVAEAHAAYANSHEDMRAFAASLTEASLDHTGDWFGNGKQLSVADSIVQVVNHGTQHRSEIAIPLTKADASPGDLDYLFFRWGND